MFKILSVPLAVAALLASTFANAEQLKVGGTGADLGTLKRLGQVFEKSHPTILIDVLPSLGSGGGIRAVLDGAIGLSVSARPLKENERERGARQIAYAKTALVFVTHRSNRVSGLTTADVQQIYGRRSVRWPNGDPIRIVLRPKSDSDTRLLETSFSGVSGALAKLRHSRNMRTAYTDQDNAAALERTPGSFGTSSLSIVLGESRSLNVLNLNGITPSPDTIANGSYPLIKTFYAILAPKSPSEAHTFLAFLRSPEAARILERTGHQALLAGQ